MQITPRAFCPRFRAFPSQALETQKAPLDRSLINIQRFYSPAPLLLAFGAKPPRERRLHQAKRLEMSPIGSPRSRQTRAYDTTLDRSPGGHRPRLPGRPAIPLRGSAANRLHCALRSLSSTRPAGRIPTAATSRARARSYKPPVESVKSKPVVASSRGRARTYRKPHRAAMQQRGMHPSDPKHSGLCLATGGAPRSYPLRKRG